MERENINWYKREGRAMIDSINIAKIVMWQEYDVRQVILYYAMSYLPREPHVA